MKLGKLGKVLAILIAIFATYYFFAIFIVVPVEDFLSQKGFLPKITGTILFTVFVMIGVIGISKVWEVINK